MRKFIRTALRDLLALLELLLIFRIAFRALQANPAAGVVSFVYSWSDYLLYPVSYIFPNIPFGGSTVDIVAVCGMIFYAIIFAVLIKVLSVLFILD